MKTNEREKKVFHFFAESVFTLKLHHIKESHHYMNQIYFKIVCLHFRAILIQY